MFIGFQMWVCVCACCSLCLSHEFPSSCLAGLSALFILLDRSPFLGGFLCKTLLHSLASTAALLMGLTQPDSSIYPHGQGFRVFVLSVYSVLIYLLTLPCYLLEASTAHPTLTVHGVR